MKVAHMIAFVLLVIGGLNWLVFALFDTDIGMLFGGMDAMISKIIYVLVGLAAIYEVAMHKQNCKHCGGMNMAGGSSMNTGQKMGGM